MDMPDAILGWSVEEQGSVPMRSAGDERERDVVGKTDWKAD